MRDPRFSPRDYLPAHIELSSLLSRAPYIGYSTIGVTMVQDRIAKIETRDSVALEGDPSRVRLTSSEIANATKELTELLESIPSYGHVELTIVIQSGRVDRSERTITEIRRAGGLRK